VLGVIADVTVGEQLDAAFGEVTSAIDHRDIVVNNVGGTLNLVRPFTDTTTVHWELLYRLNLYRIMAMSRKALPLMGRGGSIINVSTVEAHRGYPFGAVYSGFKTAITGFTRSLAVELSPQGIRANCIAPETTETALHNSTAWLPAHETNQIGDWIPLGRFGVPEDIAGAALFLASPLVRVGDRYDGARGRRGSGISRMAAHAERPMVAPPDLSGHALATAARNCAGCDDNVIEVIFRNKISEST
jgi:3-oxoacyl-[acyl-carrier protein] reductase